jgi:hypothetical protein
MDVSLAPYFDSEFFKAKSDLRWLEASALAIPTVGDPRLYTDMREDETGLWAFSAKEARKQVERLVDDHELSAKIGYQAQTQVREERDMSVAVDQWIRVFEDVVE